METNFLLARLIQWGTPAAERVYKSGGKPWWKPWEEMCRAALELEGPLGWVTTAPEVRAFLWDFFEREELQATLQDLDQLLQSVKKARFPAKTIAYWHWRTVQNFITYGESAEENERVAELEIEWIDGIAKREVAKELMRFPECLELEQAYSYSFAAQALRRAAGADEQLKRASEMLDRAEGLLRGVPGGDEQREKDRAVVWRDVKLQRAWLYEQMRNEPMYAQMMWELWADTPRDDKDASVILNSLVLIELGKRQLGDPRLIPSGLTAHDDPGNLHIGLPPGSPAEVKSLFEFRFLQYLSLVTDNPKPTAQEFAQLSEARWKNFQYYAKNGLFLCELGRTFLQNDSTRAILLDFLKALAVYYHQFEKVHLKELAALNLLAQYEPQSGVWEKHLKALDEYKALVAMYLKSTRSWLSRARHWAEFLQILENSRKRNQLEPASDSDYWRQVEGRSTILQEAKGLARKGEHHAALKLLAPLIPAARPDWILLEDLESVDLAITCAQRIGEVERVEEWLGSLRNLARGYIRQSIESITDPKAHQLAVDLMRELDTAQSAAGAS